MNTEEVVEKITRTEAIAEQNKTEIHDIKEEIADIRENNKAIYKIATSVELLAQDMTSVKQTVCDVKKSQNETKKELTDFKNANLVKKAKFLDRAIGAIVGVIGGGVLAYILSQMFPSIFK